MCWRSIANSSGCRTRNPMRRFPRRPRGLDGCAGLMSTAAGSHGREKTCRQACGSWMPHPSEVGPRSPVVPQGLSRPSDVARCVSWGPVGRSGCRSHAPTLGEGGVVPQIGSLHFGIQIRVGHLPARLALAVATEFGAQHAGPRLDLAQSMEGLPLGLPIRRRGARPADGEVTGQSVLVLARDRARCRVADPRVAPLAR